MLRTRVIGAGSFLPEKVLTNKDLEKFCDTTDEWIRQRTGIEQRHSALPEHGVSDLSFFAAQTALEEAGIAAQELDLIIVCTVTPDQIFPASANILQGKLGADKAFSFDLNAACTGFLNGLATADAMIRTGAVKTALVVGAEIATNLLDWEFRDTAVLFGDGAGAVVLRGEEGDTGVLTTHLGTDGKNYDILHLPMGGSRDPITAENINDHPYRIYMNGRELFKRAVVKMTDMSQLALDTAGYTLDDVDVFIPHQANARIIEAVGERMKIDPKKVVMNIDKVGNTIAACIPIAIHEARRDGRIKDGSLVLFSAFGAGLTWGSALIRW
jgi:3-oxoacyl-[acyl-carrier-protein] synthase III